MFQNTDTFNGKFETNIFDFKDPGISEIFITNEAYQYPLGNSYRFNKENPSYTIAYKSLHDNIGVDSLNFSIKDYPEHYFILAFDTTPDFGYSRNVARPNTSYDNMMIHIDFHTPLPQKNTLIVAAFYNKTISINSLQQTLIQF